MMSGVTDDRVRAGNIIGGALENEVGSCATTTVSNYSTGSIGHHHHHGQDSSGRASSRTVDRHQSMIANRSARRRFIGAPVEKHFPLLDSIYRYFGAKIAIYFAFLLHTCAYTLFPGLLGIPVFVNSVWEGTAQPASSAFYALFVLFAAYYMVGSWPASQAQLALTFGMIGCEASETDRPEFHGDKAKSLVDGKLQIYFSPERRGWRKNVNRAVIFTFVSWAPPRTTKQLPGPPPRPLQHHHQQRSLSTQQNHRSIPTHHHHHRPPPGASGNDGYFSHLLAPLHHGDVVERVGERVGQLYWLRRERRTDSDHELLVR